MDFFPYFNKYFQNCNVTSVKDVVTTLLNINERKTVHYLISVEEKLWKFLDESDHAEVFLTDVSKAFYCIDHEFLIAKL